MAIDQFGQVDITNNPTPPTSTSSQNNPNQNNNFFKKLLTLGVGLVIGIITIQFFSNHSPTPEAPDETTTPEVSQSTNNYSPSCNQEVDKIFYQRHPELQGRAISKNETDLVNEWLEIRNSLNSCLNQASQESNFNESGVVKTINVENAFSFPQNACGDFSQNDSLWYPVYVKNDGNNLAIIKSEYCRDAILNYREIKGENYIQIASFTSYQKASQFAQILQERFDYVEIGKPND